MIKRIAPILILLLAWGLLTAHPLTSHLTPAQCARIMGIQWSPEEGATEHLDAFARCTGEADEAQRQADAERAYKAEAFLGCMTHECAIPFGTQLADFAGPNYEVIYDPHTGIYSLEPIAGPGWSPCPTEDEVRLYLVTPQGPRSWCMAIDDLSVGDWDEESNLVMEENLVDWVIRHPIQ